MPLITQSLVAFASLSISSLLISFTRIFVGTSLPRSTPGRLDIISSQAFNRGKSSMFIPVQAADITQPIVVMSAVET